MHAYQHLCRIVVSFYLQARNAKAAPKFAVCEEAYRSLYFSVPYFTTGQYGVNELSLANAHWSHRKTIKSIPPQS